MTKKLQFLTFDKDAGISDSRKEANLTFLTDDEEANISNSWWRSWRWVNCLYPWQFILKLILCQLRASTIKRKTHHIIQFKRRITNIVIVSKNVRKGSALSSRLLAVTPNIRHATIRPYNKKETTWISLVQRIQLEFNDSTSPKLMSEHHCQCIMAKHFEKNTHLSWLNRVIFFV